MDLTEHHDLRSNALPWDAHADDLPPADALPVGMVDVAICGAGITGAMLADRLSEQGLSVVLLDRRYPACGSTSASTALVLWEADVPLSHLAERVGIERAVRCWRRVHRAVRTLADHALHLPRAHMKARQSLYLDGTLLDAGGLAREAALRVAHGFPSTFLSAEQVQQRFDIAPRPAIFSGDSYEVDPVGLTHDLLDQARDRGASMCWPVDVQTVSSADTHIQLTTDRGVVEARHAVLATGYERARLFLPEAFRLRSSYAIATAPGTAPLWRGPAMIWEASSSYLYARTDAEGRMIAGGGDEDFHDPDHRDRLIPTKAAEIAANLSRLVGRPVEPRETWAAMFGSSPDGLPAIGPSAVFDRLWLASGFGGNGVTFAALAAELLTASLTDLWGKDMDCFDPYRFGASRDAG
jgi:glycine/D-amino acid oxidase-like deaminating enzyme